MAGSSIFRLLIELAPTFVTWLPRSAIMARIFSTDSVRALYRLADLLNELGHSPVHCLLARLEPHHLFHPVCHLLDAPDQRFPCWSPSDRTCRRQSGSIPRFSAAPRSCPRLAPEHFLHLAGKAGQHISQHFINGIALISGDSINGFRYLGDRVFQALGKGPRH